jgi:hypothetical protein
MKVKERMTKTNVNVTGKKNDFEAKLVKKSGIGAKPQSVALKVDA